MRKYIIILVVVLISSCGVTKNKKQTETKTVSTETGTETVIKKGETITYTVPRINFKDTTIVVRNQSSYNGGTLKIAYDKEGNQSIDCIEQDLEIIRNYIKESQEDKLEQDKTKETVFKPILILYVFLGIAFLMILLRLLKKFGI